MKKSKILFRFIYVVAVLLVFSCDKKDDEGDPTLSKLSAEEHKSEINNIGIAFIDDMDDMSSESMIEVMINFFNLADEDNLDDELDMKSAPMAYLRQYTGLKEKPLSSLRLKSLESDEYESVTEIYQDMTGIYTYNAATSSWSKSPSSTEVVFNFPSMESKTENDTQLKIYDYNAEAADLQEIEGYTYERLTSLKIDLKVNSTVLFSYHMSASYHSDDLPKLMKHDVTMESYSWNNTFDLTNPNSEVKLSTSYKKGSTVIMTAGINAKGDFTYDNLETDAIDREDDDQSDILEDQDILKSGTIYFQIENLRAEGNVDAVQFIKDMNKADEMDYDTDEQEKAAEEAYAKAFNDNASLDIMYADKKEIIASGEMYVVEEDWEWEWNDGDLYHYYTDIRFLFSDGTAVDDSYFENGFSSLIDRMNEMIQKVNLEHDVEIEEIEE